MAGTRERLLEAAEELFGAQDVDAVSLREILRQSGARNATALQYHFGDRAGLLRALLDKHYAEVDIRRHALLDAYEAAGAPGIRPLAAALVRPLAAKLADPKGGHAFLRIYAEFLNHRQPLINPDELAGDSIIRWRDLLDPFLDEHAKRHHRRFIALRLALAELARRARTGPHTDDRLFISELIDLVAAMLLAPPSEETSRLATERRAPPSSYPAERA